MILSDDHTSDMRLAKSFLKSEIRECRLDALSSGDAVQSAISDFGSEMQDLSGFEIAPAPVSGAIPFDKTLSNQIVSGRPSHSLASLHLY
jgi:hypothetical protein